jgi:hypothetical protein
MTTNNRSTRNKNRGILNIIILAVILFVLVGIPFMFLTYQSKRTGLTRSESMKRITSRSDHGRKGSFAET